MSYPTVIGIVGAAGAGKDTLANKLVEDHGYHILRFAGPLKELCMEWFQLTAEQMNTLDGKETPTEQWVGPDGKRRTPREILQIVGTEGFRAVDPEYWVKLAQKHISRRVVQKLDFGSRPSMVAIPDVRFLNESTMLRSMFGAVIIRVEKLTGPGTMHVAHSSESEQDQIVPDTVISAQHGDLEKLYSQLAAYMDNFSICHFGD